MNAVVHGSFARPVLIIEQGGRGGIADYTAELSKALAAEGIPIVLATARDHLYEVVPGVELYAPFYYLRGGSRVRDALRRVGAQKIVNALAFLVAIPGLVRRARACELVHLQGGHLPPLFLTLVLALRASGATIVHTLHNTFDRGRSWPRARSLMVRCASCVIIHAESDLDNLPPTARRRARLIPLGEFSGVARRSGGLVDRATAREALGLDHGGLVALLFGQLRPDKGITDVLIAARDVPTLHVVLAGQDRGGLLECLELMASPELADRVHLYEGFHPVERIPVFFSAADVVVIPSRVVSQSAVLMLSYAFSRPVVAYPVGGLAEVVEHGSSGWLTSRADPGALSDTLAAVVAAGPDECRRRGEEGARLARERYGWESIARSTIAAYDDALACRV